MVSQVPSIFAFDIFDIVDLSLVLVLQGVLNLFAQVMRLLFKLLFVVQLPLV